MIEKSKRVEEFVARASRPRLGKAGGTPAPRVVVEPLDQRVLFSAPEVIFDIRNSADGSHAASVTQVGQVVSMDLIVLIAGNDSNRANDAPALIQFSVDSSTGGLLGNVNVNLAAPFNNEFSSVPAAADYDGDGDTEIGSGANATGNASDTAIATVVDPLQLTASFNSAEGAKLGEETIGGVIYSKFKIGTAAFTVNSQTLSSGESETVSFVPRIGSAAPKPQKFWIDSDSTFTSFNGDDPAVEQAGPVTITVANSGSSTPVDTTPPTASLEPIATPGNDTAAVDFTVDITDNVAVNAASIGNGDITVTGPNGFSENAILLATNGSGQNLSASFRVDGPNGIFSSTANGTYAISLNSGSVADTSGNTVAGAVLGTFAINAVSVPSGPNLGGSVLSIPKIVAPSSKNNKVTFRVTNTGTQAFSGNVAVKVYASASGLVDKKSVVLIPGATLTKVNLAAGAGKNFTLAFNAPAKIADAQYHLIVVLDPANKIKEQYKSDNVLVSTPTVRLAGPIVDLSPALVSVPATISRKKKTPLKIKITNGGTVTAKGTAHITVFAVVGAKTVQIASLASSVSLAALAAKIFTLTADASKVSAGSHALRATVTFSGSPGDSKPANNNVTSSSTVTFV